MMPAKGGFLAVFCCSVVGCAALPAVPPAAAPPPSSAAVGGTQIVAIAAPAAPHPTLFDFLGITPVCGVIQQEVRHKIAFFGTYFPSLEPKPPLLPLTDPANLASPIPAVATAAEIKAAQDAAPQKIKALKYLATIGCGGCYPGVEEAILAALDDCTEEVRFAAVNTVLTTAGSPCVHCNNKACCSPAIRKRLLEIANEACPCPTEPSARVRRVARLALSACGAPPPIDPVPEIPTEVIPDEAIPGPFAPGETIPPPPPPPTTATVPEAQKWVDATPVRWRSEESRNSSNPIAESVSHSSTSEGDDIVVASHDESLDKLDVDLETLRSYYLTHQDRYRNEPRVRWEEIELRVDQFASSDEAYAVMNHVRNRALGQRSVAPVSYRPSQLSAKHHDWTTRADVGSDIIKRAVFSQPVGVVSPVLQTGESLVLVRVLETEAARQRSFDEAVEDVKRDWIETFGSQSRRGSVTNAQMLAPASPASDADGVGDSGIREKTRWEVNPFAEEVESPESASE